MKMPLTSRLKGIAVAALSMAPLGLLTGCDRAPVSEADANRYEMAVYFNPNRPRNDRKADERRKPAQLMEFAGVEPGMTVIDLCGGDGWFTELLANVVGPTGRVVIANPTLFTDIAGEALTTRLKGDRLRNVTRIDGTWGDMKLPVGADMVWLGLAYHDIYVKRPDKPEWEADRDAFFAQVFAALKPGGLLMVTDHAAAAGSGITAAQTLHRIDEEFARQDILNAGFEFVAMSDLLRISTDDYTKDIWSRGPVGSTDQFILLFRKPR